MKKLTPIAILSISLMVLSGCSNAPKPSLPEGSRTPLNTPENTEYLALKGELESIKKELIRQSNSGAKITEVTPTSELVIINFKKNSTVLKLSNEMKASLLPYIHNAKRIEVRGRTDAQQPSKEDEKVAIGRAVAAKKYLVSQGVPANIISVNYLSAGDYLNTNQSAMEKSENRRVEIEMLF